MRNVPLTTWLSSMKNAPAPSCTASSPDEQQRTSSASASVMCNGGSAAKIGLEEGAWIALHCIDSSSAKVNYMTMMMLLLLMMINEHHHDDCCDAGEQVQGLLRSF